jgi:hypothetical protein
MRDLDSYGMGWGSLTLIGQFAPATGTDNRVFLERCGCRAVLRPGLTVWLDLPTEWAPG